MPVYVFSIRRTFPIDQTMVQLEAAAVLLILDQKSHTLQSCDAAETHCFIQFV